GPAARASLGARARRRGGAQSRRAAAASRSGRHAGRISDRIRRENMRLTGLAQMVSKAVNGIEFLSPVFDLAIRLCVAKGVFMSGLTKIQSWDSTLSLFENEYAVPLLSPELAAYLGTAAELCLPPLLVLGIS